MFRNCSKLSEITISDNVTDIGDWAFSGCKSLTGVIIPDNVTYIGFCAFKDCSSLIVITIPVGIGIIDSSTFENCDSLTDVYYTGSADQWRKILIDEEDNESLLNATIHYGN